MDEAKTTKISNFWTFWPIIPPIDHLCTYRLKDSLLTKLSSETSRESSFFAHIYQVSLKLFYYYDYEVVSEKHHVISVKLHHRRTN